jgi:acetyl esterase/lipase
MPLIQSGEARNRELESTPALFDSRDSANHGYYLEPMKSRFLLAAVFLFVIGRVASAAPTAEFPLWPEGKVPGALGTEPKDTPTLTPFWPAPEKATGAAIIVFPGGGYQQLAPHEGEPYARWLNDLGITAFVLKYRLYPGGYHLQEIFQDAARAVRTVRANAADWKIDPKRIGVIGSSAGGHLAAVLSTQFDAGKADAADPIERVSSRPDATILCYAFILFDEKTMTNPKSREAALGKDVPDEVALRFAPARNVRQDTPPCFIWQTVEDPGVLVENAFAFADALRAAHVHFALQLFEQGRHGLGLGAGVKAYTPDAPLHPWTRDCAFWLGEQGFAKKSP